MEIDSSSSWLNVVTLQNNYLLIGGSNGISKIYKITDAVSKPTLIAAI